MSPVLHTSNICSCQNKHVQFSCDCEKFHLVRFFGFLVINICDHGEHYETPCICGIFSEGLYLRNDKVCDNQ